jgi:DNA polymerase II large subunit
MARELVEKYNISSYTKEVMELLEEYVEAVFGVGERQSNLSV